MNIEHLKEKWKKEEENAKIIGWDFSYVDGRLIDLDELPWDYKTIIEKYLKENDVLLDYDTGGGEFLLSLNHKYEYTKVTEGYKPNVLLCEERLIPLGIDFKECSDPSNIPFSDETFDIIINRHGSYNHQELYRLLKKGGYFITQQVGEENDRDLVKLLLPDINKSFPGFNLKGEVEKFEETGFEILECNEAFPKVKFLDIESLIWFSKIIEWEFVDFSVDKCFDNLLKVYNTIIEKGGIEGTTHRFMIVAKK